MQHGSDILLSLFIVFIAAQIGAELSQRIKLPSVVGEIIAGCVVGPSVLHWVQPSESLNVLAEIGVVLLLFSVGLETRLDDLKQVGKKAFSVGILGVIIPFILGASWAHYSGFQWHKSLFIAAAFVATSAGITARVLQELGALQRIESRIILGAAVIDDILAMLVLGVVVALQSTDALQLDKLAIIFLSAVGFIAIIGWGGSRLMRRSSNLLERPLNPLSPLSIVLALCLGLAFLSTQFGLAAIIGAFLAGMMASETQQRELLEHQTKPLLAFLTPFFFVITGTQIDLSLLTSSTALIMLAVVTGIAIISKFMGGFLGALQLGRNGATIVGVGMIPRGEVGVVIATLGLDSKILSPMLYAVIVAMSLLTAIVTPPIIAFLLKKHIR